jgi:cadmium resistance protein CadD (predicted permease)
VTFSNGGDNIGIYTPLFAKYNGFGEVSILVVIFMLMTGIWYLVGYYLVNHPSISNRLRKTGHIILPFVLIGLGIYIIVDSFVLGI